MEDNNEALSVYVDLESLIDTRLVLFHEFDKKYTEKILEDGTYFIRIADELSYSDSETFSRIYKDRNKKTIFGALPTGMYETLFEYLAQAKNIITTENVDDIKLTVNTYPFELEKELKKYFVYGIGKKIQNIVDVEVIYKDTREITPLYIKDIYGMVIMYEGLRWMDDQMMRGNFNNYTLPDTVLLVPMLITNRDLLAKKEYFKFFDDTAKQLGVFMNVVFEHPGVFSADFSKIKK